jgi:hypothetical protein
MGWHRRIGDLAINVASAVVMFRARLDRVVYCWLFGSTAERACRRGAVSWL